MVAVVVLCCFVETACGFKTFKPNELSTAEEAIQRCAITRYIGVFGYNTNKSIILIDPTIKGDVNYLDAVVKKGRKTLGKGSVVNIISISSGWDSDVGSYIVAKATVPSLGGRVVRIRRYYVLNHSPTRQDFEGFLDKDFAPCK